MMTTITINAVMAPRRGNPDIKMAIDGVKQGRHEGRENDPEDFRVADAGQASRGYRDWMGPIWVYQNAYRDGYRAGFRAGYNNESRAWGDRDGDSDNFPAVYSGGSYGGPWFGNRAYQIGFQDGASVAREDAARGKPYNPRPRGRYDDEDHGYSSAYGNKGAYKTQYANGYRAGYESARGRYQIVSSRQQGRAAGPAGGPSRAF